jgi:hypothetical protein
MANIQYIKDFEETICTEMVNNYLEYRGNYLFCFMVSGETQSIHIK